MSQPAQGFAVLRQRDYTLYVGARFFSSIGSQMLIVAVGWQVYQKTGRLFDLGMIGLSQFLPFLCLALFAGHAADTFDRRAILFLCGGAQLACALLLLVFAATGLALTWPIFAVLALLRRGARLPDANGTVAAAEPDSARNARQRHCARAPRHFRLPRSRAQAQAERCTRSLRERGDRGRRGPGVCSSLRVVRGGDDDARADAGTARWRASGCHQLGQPARGTAFRLASQDSARRHVAGSFAVLFGGATALLPAFTRDVLHAGPGVFGLLRTAPG